MSKQRVQRTVVRGLIGVLAVWVTAHYAGAATINVGPTRTYTTVQAGINAAADGDTVLIDPGTYMGAAATMDLAGRQNITIQGSGGRAVLNLSDTISPTNGFYADNASVNHEGMVRIHADGGGTPCANVTFSSIEWMHAGMKMNDTMDYGQNGACIRVDNCTGTITLRNCVMRDSQQGFVDFSVSPHTVDIQNCIFHDCGDITSIVNSGYTHNLYVRPASDSVLIFEYNWSYNCHCGYCLKTCVGTNYIMYNRMGDEMGLALDAIPHSPTNPVGSAVDIPNGGLTYLIGNVLQNVPTSIEGNIVEYGEEGIAAGYSTQFYAVYNTVLGRRNAATAFYLSNVPLSTVPYIANNVFVHDGDGTLVTGLPNWDYGDIHIGKMLCSNLVLDEADGANPPAVHRYMYDANGYDGDGNIGTPGTYVNWDVLNVEPIDPNHITFPHAGVTYQTLINLALLPGSDPLALPAVGIDGASLTATYEFSPMPSFDCMPFGQARSHAWDVGAYLYLWMPYGHPSIQSFTCPNDYIYEGWTVTLAAVANDVNASLALTAAFSQTAGQTVTFGTASTPSSPLPVTWTFPVTLPLESLTSVANETLIFSLTATDTAWLTTAPAIVTVKAYMAGDINHDNAVNLADLKALVAVWNSMPASGNWNQAADLDGDSAVNLGDLKLLVANWNRRLQ